MGAHSKIGVRHVRESPSGKASAFQADIRGFESHLPLLFLAISFLAVSDRHSTLQAIS